MTARVIWNRVIVICYIMLYAKHEVAPAPSKNSMNTLSCITKIVFASIQSTAEAERDL